jgi:20S proteasome alpha/beta subunit
VTLVLGLASNDGIVLASDSQVSQGLVRGYGKKVWAVEDGPFVFGLAGAESTMQRLEHVLRGLKFSTTDSWGIRGELSEIVGPAFDSEYAFVRQRMGGFHDWSQMPVAGAIVGVFAEGHPYLLEVDRTGTVVNNVRGFASMGSARNFAEHASAVYRELLNPPPTLHQATMLAFRIVQDAIEIAGPSAALARPIQIVRLYVSSGRVIAAQLHDDDPEFDDLVNSWMAVEADRFRAHAPPADWEIPPDWRAP